MTPTLEIYSALQNAFDHFNAELFEGRLPQCLITLRSSSRAYGYMHKRRFVNIAGQQIDELGINPGYFAIQSLEEVMATLVHEMVHHWQNHFGSPLKTMPHDREWAEKMQSLGLMPSHDGQPGGKKIGRSMSDYILPEGPFIMTAKRLSDTGFELPWYDSHVSMSPAQMLERRSALESTGEASIGGTPPFVMALKREVELPVTVPTPARKPAQRVRFVCRQCGIRAWAAPETALECGTCNIALASNQPGGTESKA
jgi:hypothetical protein